MKTPFSFGLVLCLAVLLGGCATHYYRLAKDGAHTLFYLRQPEAASVVLFASHDGFTPQISSLRERRWVNTLPSAQEFTYFYRIDGQLFVPDCPFREQDDFGQENCIFLPSR
jgi:hypothetical protein